MRQHMPNGDFAPKTHCECGVKLVNKKCPPCLALKQPGLRRRHREKIEREVDAKGGRRWIQGGGMPW